MAQYEYMIVQNAAGARTSLLNERIEAMVKEGWEPFMMAGDSTINVMLRRPRAQATPRVQEVAQAAATTAAPGPAAVRPPTSTPQPAPAQR